MFSAVYLVCMLGQPCMSATDVTPYNSLETCKENAETIIAMNQARVVAGELAPFTAEYQCVSWDKA